MADEVTVVSEYCVRFYVAGTKDLLGSVAIESDTIIPRVGELVVFPKSGRFNVASITHLYERVEDKEAEHPEDHITLAIDVACAPARNGSG